MRKYFVPLWVVYVAKLLGKSPRSKELYTISTVTSGNNESQQLTFVPDGNNICHDTSFLNGKNILCKSDRVNLDYFRRYFVLDNTCLSKKKGVTACHRNPLDSLWWRRGDLNSRPPPCEGDALPAELLPHMDATTRRSEVCMPFTCRGQVFFARAPGGKAGGGLVSVARKDRLATKPASVSRRVWACTSKRYDGGAEARHIRHSVLF